MKKTLVSAALLAAMAAIRNDQEKMESFEDTAAYMLPHDPVARKCLQAGTKRGAANISLTNAQASATNNSSTTPKVSKGKTGVEFRFYALAEYRRLTTEQQEELQAHRQIHGPSRRPPKDNKGRKAKQAKAIAAAVEQQLDAKLKELQNPPEQPEQTGDKAIKSFIMSLMGKNPTEMSTTSTSQTAAARALRKILGKTNQEPK